MKNRLLYLILVVFLISFSMVSATESYCTEIISPCGGGCPITDFTGMFENYNFMNDVNGVGNITGWDTSCVTNMNSMFFNSDFNQDIGNWDVSNVLSMSIMFTNSQFNKNINGWNVGKVTDFSTIFSGAWNFNQPLNSWNMSSATTINDMFANTNYNQPLNSWNVSNVINFAAVFGNNGAFNQDISMWDVSKGANFQLMFYYSSSFNQPIGIWNTSSATNMFLMFDGATSFNQDISNWDFSKVNNLNGFIINNNEVFSTTNYDLLLNSLSSQTLQTGVTMDVNSDYSISSESSRDFIINTYSWTINDLGFGITGCMDSTALNYDAFATISGDCTYEPVIIFYGGATNQSVVKYDVANQEILAVSPDFGGAIQDIMFINDYVYATGSTGYIKEYYASNLSFTGKESDDVGVYGKNKLFKYKGYIYALSGVTVRKYDFDDLSFTGVESVTFDEGAISHIIIDNKLYVGTTGNNAKIRVFDLNTLELLQISEPIITAGLRERYYTFDYLPLYNENYLIAGSASRFILLDKNTLTFVASGASQGGGTSIRATYKSEDNRLYYYLDGNNRIDKTSPNSISRSNVGQAFGVTLDLIVLDDKVYAGGTYNKVVELNSSNVYLTGKETPNYGGAIYSIDSINYYGCTDVNAFNYDENADIDDYTCIYPLSLNNEPYTYLDNFVKVDFTNITGLLYDGDIKSGNNWVYVNPITDMNVPATITFNHTDVNILSYPTRNGDICGEDWCTNIVNTGTQLTFDVLGWSNYSYSNFGCMDEWAINYDAASDFDDGSCEYNSFVSEWVVAEGVTISLNMVLAESNFRVDWGDGSSAEYNVTSHTYTGITGNVNITIDGRVSKFTGYVNSWTVGCSGNRLRHVHSWGNTSLNNNIFTDWGRGQFTGCTGIISFTNDSAPDLSEVTSLNSLMISQSGFTATSFTGKLGSWDVSNVNDFTYFLAIQNNYVDDFSNWNIRNDVPVSFERAFYTLNGRGLNIGNITNWDMSAVTNMHVMFFRRGLQGETATTDFSKWDIRNATSLNWRMGSGITNDQYNDMLIEWSKLDVKTGVQMQIMEVSHRQYNSTAYYARKHLINTYNWNIIDNGYAGVIGCMDPQALNYDMNANFQPYPEVCQYEYFNVSTCEELQAIQPYFNDYLYTDNYYSYQLTNDIDCINSKFWSGGFQPIINFRGTLEGNGYNILNLFINRPTTADQALFRNLYGTAKNFGLVNINVVGQVRTAGVATSNFGSIENVFVTGRVHMQLSNNNVVGGLVADNYGKVFNSYVSANVTNLGGTSMIGGVVGRNLGRGNILNTYSSGYITPTTASGGLISSTVELGASTFSLMSVVDFAPSRVFYSEERDLNFISGLTNLGSSRDLYNWDYTTFTFNINKMAYSDALGLFILVGDGGNIQKSYDGKNWEEVKTGGNNIRWVIYDKELGMFMYVGGVTTTAEIGTSYDGDTWNIQTIPDSSALNFVMFIDDFGKFYAYGSSVALTSEDGFNWQQHSTGVPINMAAYSNVSKNFMAVRPDNSGTMYISNDGFVWTAIGLGDYNQFVRSVIYVPEYERFLIGGLRNYFGNYRGQVRYSTDGVTILGATLILGSSQPFDLFYNSKLNGVLAATRSSTLQLPLITGGLIKNSFWDIITTEQLLGRPDVSSIYGLETEQMYNITNYLDAGWDITSTDETWVDEVWIMNDGESYPILAYYNYPPSDLSMDPEARYWSPENITIIFDASYNTLYYKYCVTTDGTECIPDTTSDGMLLHNEGAHTVCISAFNEVGTESDVLCSQQNAYKIDRTNPETEHIITGYLGNNDWYLSEVFVDLTSTDELSGILNTFYCVDNENTCNPNIEYNETINLTIDDYYYIRYYSVDNALNSEDVKSTLIKIDSLKPITTGSVHSGILGTNNWYITNVEFKLEGVDNTTYANSGHKNIYYCVDNINSCIPNTIVENNELILIENEGQNFIRYRSEDVAGNIEEINIYEILIDKTNPVSTFEIVSGSEGNNDWYTTNVNFKIITTDSVSGMYQRYYCVDQDNICVPNILHTQQDITITNEGNNYIRYFGIDNAGNDEIIGFSLVKIDKTTPYGDGIITYGALGNNDWYISDIEYSINSFDDYSGVYQAYYCIDFNNVCVPNITYITPVVSENEGSQYIRYYIEDNAGLNSVVYYDFFKVDKTTPITSGNITQGMIGLDNKYRPYVEYSIFPEDEYSQVNITYYCVDDINDCFPSIEYTSSLLLSKEDNNYVRYYSVDYAGLEQTVQTSGNIEIGSIFNNDLFNDNSSDLYPGIYDTILLNAYLDTDIHIDMCTMYISDYTYSFEDGFQGWSAINQATRTQDWASHGDWGIKLRGISGGVVAAISKVVESDYIIFDVKYLTGEILGGGFRVYENNTIIYTLEKEDKTNFQLNITPGSIIKFEVLSQFGWSAEYVVDNIRYGYYNPDEVLTICGYEDFEPYLIAGVKEMISGSPYHFLRKIDMNTGLVINEFGGSTSYDDFINNVVVDGNFVYGIDLKKIIQYNLNDLSETGQTSQDFDYADYIVIKEDYIYVSSAQGNIYKVNKNDLSYTGFNVNVGHYINRILIDENYLYVVGYDNVFSPHTTLKRYNLIDLSFVDESEPYGDITGSLNISSINAIDVDENYVYIGGYTDIVDDAYGRGIVKKYNKTNLEYVSETIDYTAYISDIKVVGDYIYASTTVDNNDNPEPRVVIKFNKNTMLPILESINLQGNIRNILEKDDYLYVSVNKYSSGTIIGGIDVLNATTLQYIKNVAGNVLFMGFEVITETKYICENIDLGLNTNIMINNTPVINYELPFKYVVNKVNTIENNLVSWYSVCNDTYDNEYTSELQYFTVKDNSPPEITIESNTNIFSNSVISKDLYDININVSFFDYSLENVRVEILCEESNYILQYTNNNINNDSYIFNTNVNISSYPYQKCNLYIEAEDTPNVYRSSLVSNVSFDFYIGGTIYTTAKNTWNDNTISGYYYNIQTTSGQPYISKSGFISGTNGVIENIPKGNYSLVFSHPQYFTKTLNVNLVDESLNVEYLTSQSEITFKFRNVKTLIPITNVTFTILSDKSLYNNVYDSNIYSEGGTTYVVKRTWTDLGTNDYFFIDKITNQLQNNYASYTAFARYKFTYFDNTTAYSEERSKYGIGYTTFTYNNPNSKKPVIKLELEMRQNTPHTTRLAQVTNQDITLVERYYTGSSSEYKMEMNSDEYTILWSVLESSYVDMNKTFTTGFREIQTLILDTFFEANFILIDERTLSPFDMLSPTRVDFQIFCPESTSSKVLGTTSSNFTTLINCNYRLLRFQVEYDATGYYRSFILEPDNLLNVRVYLVNLLNTQIVYNSFYIDDLLSRYINPRVYVLKLIDDKTEQITANYADIENKVGAFLIENHPYIVEVHSDNMPVYRLGEYSADAAGTKNIRLYEIEGVDAGSFREEKVYYSISTIKDENETLVIGRYKDIENLTTDVTFTVYEIHTGVVLYTTTATSNPTPDSPNDIIFSYNVTEYYEDVEIYAEIVANRPVATSRTKVEHSVRINTVTKITNKIFDYVGQDTMNWILIMVLGVIAIMATMHTANIVSIVLIGLATVFVLFGWLSLSPAVLAIAGLVALLSTLKDGEKMA